MVGEAFDGITPSDTSIGSIAKVSFLPDRVVMTPALGANREGLAKKIQHEKLFRSLTRGITGLYHPRFILEDEKAGKYEIERATGFNLTTQRGQIHGGGLTEFFRIPTPFKTDAMITYLKAISAVNKGGYAFVDHKGDSVFINPNLNRISVVDADAIEPNKADNVWKRELTENRLQKMLRRFFTRDSGVDNESFLTPAGPSIVIDSLSNCSNAEEAINLLDGWRQGKSVIPYNRVSREKMKGNFEFLASSLNSPELNERIKALDLGPMSDFQVDMLETDLYTGILLKSEEPQMIDKHLLGVNN